MYDNTYCTHYVDNVNCISESRENKKNVCLYECYTTVFLGFHQKSVENTTFIRGFYKKTHFFTVFCTRISGLLKQLFH